jgi:isoleucyl-tRNA synthetase
MPADKTIEYKNTLNLPKTDFPMKANLSQREPEMLKKWEEQNLFSKLREFSKGKPKFILHDGPPYANGHIHLGHCLNKILKDIIVKSQTLFGKDSYYLPGWDCHGLPIEYQVLKKLGSKKADKTKAEIRKLCRDYALRFVDIQRDEFKRLAVFGDWENPYLTMSYDYEANIARELGTFMENGGLYRGKKPVYWCYSCQTALAEAEVEYEDKTSDSVYVKFKLLTKIFTTQYPSLKGRDVYAVIWTTTPWTLPANQGLAFHPEFEYSAVEHNGDVLIIADELKESVLGQNLNVLEVINGKKFQSLKFQHPLYDRESLGINANYVTLEAGTGIVHIAPGHGQDDLKCMHR